MKDKKEKEGFNYNEVLTEFNKQMARLTKVLSERIKETVDAIEAKDKGLDTNDLEEVRPEP